VVYRIEFKPAARRQFARLPRRVQERIKPEIDALALNPRPVGAVKLEGAYNLYRIRKGDYRILYQIQDQILLVLVVKIGHRRDVYRQ
jgi:mRNA interferase RelE/StbE